MKLRTTQNSIRIRIRKSELTTLQREGVVEESVHFPNALFRFSLAISPLSKEILISFSEGHIKVILSESIANQWMSSQQVGIEREIALGNDKQLHLLIEKDFPCLDRPEEDKSDTFWELAPKTPDSC